MKNKFYILLLSVAALCIGIGSLGLFRETNEKSQGSQINVKSELTEKAFRKIKYQNHQELVVEPKQKQKTYLKMLKFIEKQPDKIDKQIKTKLIADQADERIQGLDAFYENPNAPEELAIYVLEHDSDPTVREHAAKLLDAYDESKEAVAALVFALTNADDEVRESAITSLKAIRNDYVQKELESYIKNKQFDLAMESEARLFLDQYYLRFDPFGNPLKND